MFPSTKFWQKIKKEYNLSLLVHLFHFSHCYLLIVILAMPLFYFLSKELNLMYVAKEADGFHEASC